MKQISGNKLLVKALKEEGVEYVFGYPGACTIDISDELYKQDDVTVILPRHEQALVHAADAYARTTGKVGVCLVTSGPGATNLVTGLATANYDSVPLVCFTGQVARHLIGNDAFQEVVEKTGVPVVTTIMGRGAIPTNHPLFIGNLGMHGAYAANMAVSNCDVLFSIGTRFNDRITGKLHEFAPNAQIIHIDIDTASISRNIQVDIPIVADAKDALAKMSEYVSDYASKKWNSEINSWKQEHPLVMRPNDRLSPVDIINQINCQFEEAIIVTDVGQHQMLVSQYAEITPGKQLVMSGGLGTMGYGFPGGVGAKIGNPDKPVIVISGDGGMQMNIQEFATAVLEELPLILCVFNNEYLGMVRQWQKLFYGKRYSMTNLRSGALSRRTNGEEYPKYTPDFVKLAESYGAKGIRVFNKNEVAAAFEEAKKNTKVPTLIEFIIDPEEMVYPMVKPGGTLEDLIMDC